MLPKLPRLGWTALAVVAASFSAALVVQFVPIATYDTTIPVPGTAGATAGAEAYAWEGHFHAEGFGNRSASDTSWHDNDFDDDDGIGMLRAAGPLLVAGCAVALAAAIAFLRMPQVAIAASWLAAILLFVGVVLAMRGLDALFEGDQEWAFGFWLAILAAALAATAGALGIAAVREAAPPAAGTP